MVEERSVGAGASRAVPEQQHLAGVPGLRREAQNRDDRPGAGDRREHERQAGPGPRHARRGQRQEHGHDQTRRGVQGRPRRHREGAPAGGQDRLQAGLRQAAQENRQRQQLDRRQKRHDDERATVRGRDRRHLPELRGQDNDDDGRHRPGDRIDAGKRDGVADEDDREQDPVQAQVSGDHGDASGVKR